MTKTTKEIYVLFEDANFGNKRDNSQDKWYSEQELRDVISKLSFHSDILDDYIIFTPFLIKELGL